MTVTMKLIAALMLLIGSSSLAQYLPDWDSIDSRPLPSWYDESKVGIFIHWGVFSVPSFGSEWFWWNWKGLKNKMYTDFMERNYPRNFTYAEFAPQLTAEFFNASEWAQLFRNSGAKYVVLTSKHHEGYTLWPSKYSFNWNAMDVGPKRDVVGDLAKAVRAENIHFGLYHSLFEWFNPLYLQDKANLFHTDNFVTYKILPEMKELIYAYEPDVLWSDGDWEPSYEYWKSTDFLAWLYNESPVRDKVVTNDRWGRGTTCKHGGFLTCSDKFNPGVVQKRKWENCMTLDRHSWGYRRNAPLADYLTIQDLLKTMAETVSCGGNLLVNVGPTKDGRIAPIYEERLRQMGQWLSINGEAIYGSKPWTAQNDTVTPGVWYTSFKEAVYAIVLDWPKESLLSLGAIHLDPSTTISLLGYSTNLQWTSSGGVVRVTFPTRSDVSSEWAWVLKFSTGGIQNPVVIRVP